MIYSRENLVPSGAPGFVVAIQYWAGDEARAFRLARLLTAIEQRPRRDMVTVALCRRFDMLHLSPELIAVRDEVGTRFAALMIRSEREGVGHPAGANGLWSGTFEKLSTFWSEGKIHASSVMFVEADGCPLRHDWLDVVRREHDRAVLSGKRVIGARMPDVPHVNGTLVSHLSLWRDRPSLHETPPDEAWDIFHRAVFLQESAPSHAILNAYGSGAWSGEALVGAGKQSAWLASAKDDSAVEWAEGTLPARAAAVHAEEDRYR